MNIFLKFIVLFSIFIISYLTSFAQVVERFKSHARYLSSDEMKGRGTGSREIRTAADYISDQFGTIGLKAINGDSYFQFFEIPDQNETETNVIGFIPASTSTNRSLIFTAHYDAYGIVKKENSEDSIYNGAQDNAIGVAALIELARMFKEESFLTQNMVFIATAAEELGAYGSLYYVQNPIFPLREISICLNIDGFNVSGLREDYFVLPRQGIDFVDEIESVATSLGWYYVSPDWVDNMNKSFDTASFLAEGIPAITIWTGTRLKGGENAGWPKLGRIHTSEDEINEHWSWEGVEDHIFLYKAIANYFLEYPNDIKVINPKMFKGQ